MTTWARALDIFSTVGNHNIWFRFHTVRLIPRCVAKIFIGKRIYHNGMFLGIANKHLFSNNGGVENGQTDKNQEILEHK